MPTRPRTLVLTLAAALLLAVPLRGQELPNVAAMFSDQTEVAIIVPSMATLSDQLANFESAAGLEGDELQDVLGMFQRELGLLSGLNRDGAMMVLIGGAAAAAADEANSTAGVMLLPVADYAAFVGALGGDPEQPVTAITLPDGSAGFCKQVEGFAVMGGSEPAVTAVAVGDGRSALTALVGPGGVTTIASSQLSVVVNNQAIGAEALAPRLSAITAAMLRQIDPWLAVDMAPEPWMPMLEALSKKASEGTTAMVIGASFSDAGLTYTEAAMLKEGSELASMYKTNAQPIITSVLLAQLPDRPMLFAAAGDPQSLSLAMLIDSIGGIVGLDPEHALGPVREPMDQMLENATGAAFGLYAVPGGNKVISHWFNSVTLLTTDDPAGQRAAVKQFITGLNGATLPMASGESIQLIAMYRENDREIEGVTIDTFTLRMSVPDSAKTGALTQAIAVLAGGGFTGHVASGPGHVLITTVDDNNMTAEALRGIGQTEGIGATGPLADLRERHLPARPIVQAYLSFNGVAESINPFLQMMGNASTINVPANLPPIAMGTTREGQSVRSVSFIPAETIKLMVTEDFDLSGSDEADQPGF